MILKQALTYANAAALVLWPASVMAATKVAEDPLQEFSPMLIAALLLLATASGVTSLLLRLYLVASSSTSREITLKGLLIASHMAAAWMASILAFGLCKIYGLDFWEIVVAVLLASFSGSTFIERVLAARNGGMVTGLSKAQE